MERREQPKPHKPGTAVNHPAHYNMGKFEVIDVIEDWNLGFNDGNAVKYIARARFKGNEVQDLEKAKWYIERQVEEAKRRRQAAVQNAAVDTAGDGAGVPGVAVPGQDTKAG